MKILRQILSTALLLCMCVIFTACPSPEPDTVEDFVDLSQTSLSYEATGSSTTHPVAEKTANELGLYDMMGNVCEWCLDWYDAGYSRKAVIDPTGPASGKVRVLRGCDFNTDVVNCRLAGHYGWFPEKRRLDSGLRLVL